MTKATGNEGRAQMQASSVDSDHPCLSLTDDKLGRKALVKGLVAQIINRTYLDSMVFSVEGPWGSGKSSFLNFLETELKSQEGIRIVRFEPWWFSSADDLIVRFFQAIQSSLGRVNDKKIGRIAEKAGEIAKLAKPAAALVPGLKETVELIVEASGTISKAAAEKHKDIRLLRAEMESGLDIADSQIVVLIDDLDRLQQKEIIDVFRMLKGISALRRVIFIIAFDTTIVQNALAAQGGAVYLEKIIQCPIHLPHATLYQLQTQIDESLSPLLTSEYSKTRWWSYYNEVFIGYLTTYRSIKRLANVSLSLYPLVEGEVEPADFLAVQGLRLFFPAAYGLLATYETGARRSDLKVGMSIKSPADFLEETLGAENWRPVRPLIEALFREPQTNPMLSPARNLTTYFQLSPEEGEISNKQWVALVRELSHGPERLIELLEEKSGDRWFLDSVFNRIDLLVERPRGLDMSIPTNLIEALLSCGDSILAKDKPRFLNFPISWSIDRAILLSCKHLGTDTSIKLLRKLVKQSTEAASCARLGLAIEECHKAKELLNPAESSALMSLLPYLKRQVIKKIRARASTDSLWNEDGSFLFLHSIWCEWEASSAASRWLQRLLKANPPALAELVHRSFGEFERKGIHEWRSSTRREFKISHLEGLERLVGWKRKTLHQKLKQLLRTPLPSPAVRAEIETVIKVIENNSTSAGPGDP